MVDGETRMLKMVCTHIFFLDAELKLIQPCSFPPSHIPSYPINRSVITVKLFSGTLFNFFTELWRQANSTEYFAHSYVSRGATGGGGVPPSMLHTLAKDMSLNRCILLLD